MLKPDIYSENDSSFSFYTHKSGKVWFRVSYSKEIIFYLWVYSVAPFIYWGCSLCNVFLPVRFCDLLPRLLDACVLKLILFLKYLPTFFKLMYLSVYFSGILNSVYCF